MELEKTVIDDKQMLFELPKEAGQLQIVKGKLIETKDNTVLLAIKEGQLLSVADEKTFDDKQEYDRLMILTPPWEIMAPYLAAYYQEKYQLSNASNAPIVIPQELQQGVAVCAEPFDCLIDFLGYVSTSKKETKAVKKGVSLVINGQKNYKMNPLWWIIKEVQQRSIGRNATRFELKKALLCVKRFL